MASGKIVAELRDVSFRYSTTPTPPAAAAPRGGAHLPWGGPAAGAGAAPIVSHFSATILRGDKVGLIGPNGAGKTTLLKLILGELQPTAGTVRQGTRLQVAYFDQMRSRLDLDATLADSISPGSEWIEAGGQRKHVMSWLSDFLFAPERARSPVRTLSGGERNRVLLARLFALPANVLVLDEPTNDLDIDTLELLEERLQAYAGTVFLVSHDRRFLDNVVTSTIAWEGEQQPGFWREYEGGYEDWLTQRARVRTALWPKRRVPRRRRLRPPLLRPRPRQRASLASRSSASCRTCRRASMRWRPSSAPSGSAWPAPSCTPASRNAWPSCRRAMRPSKKSCCRRWIAGRRCPRAESLGVFAHARSSHQKTPARRCKCSP